MERMKVICVDDDEKDLRNVTTLCGALPFIDEVKGFTSGEEALKWMETNVVHVVILDVVMPEMNGLELAKKIKSFYRNVQIIFASSHPEYAVEAFEIKAAGYLLKPVEMEKLKAEAEYALGKVENTPHVVVHTFGTFDILVDGVTMHFKRAKAKEILAYLIDMEGGSVTRGEIFAALWEDKSTYDRAMQKQVDVNLRSLKETLAEYGVSGILEMKGGFIRIRPEKMECDLYRFMRGEPDAVRAYRGVYMNPYAWAEFTEAYMTRKEQNGGNVGHLLDIK